MQMINQIDESVGADSPDRDQLTLLRRTLNEKQEIINVLNAEITDLLEGKEEIVDEIDQADIYKEELLAALAKVDHVLNPSITPGTTSHTDAAPPVTLGTPHPVEPIETPHPADPAPSETRSNRV